MVGRTWGWIRSGRLAGRNPPPTVWLGRPLGALPGAPSSACDFECLVARKPRTTAPTPRSVRAEPASTTLRTAPPSPLRLPIFAHSRSTLYGSLAGTLPFIFCCDSLLLCPVHHEPVR